MGWGRTVAVVVFISAGGLASAAGVNAGGLLSPAEQNRLSLQMERRPMVFFIAKGPADSCGPGCNQWIAAEGALMPGTAKRLEDFLAAPSRPRLPVFLHSRGGSAHEGFEIGKILRKHGMTAGIGRTVPERCRVFSTKDEACQRLISSGGDVKARLSLREGHCHSACVYAFVGASIRRVGSGAMLGVHAPRFDPEKFKQEVQAQGLPNVRPMAAADVHGGMQQYLSVMGVDPRLQETARKVDTRRMYILSRDEIVRFRIENNGPYESQWFPFQLPQRAGLLKSVAKQDGPDDSAAVFLECAGLFGLRLSYLRVLPSEMKYRPNISFGLAGGPELPTATIEAAGIAVWSIVVPVHSIERAVEHPTIAVIGRYSPAADRKSERIEISTGGLAAALANLRKLCTERESGGSPWQRSQQSRDSRT